MIRMYTGTPGSGKSLHATFDIFDTLYKKKHVICNYNLDFTRFKKANKHKFHYVPNEELSPEYLINFARAYFREGREGQGLLVIDEASILFNCRDFGRRDRSDWVVFFQTHRKYGWDIIFITQFDRMLDKQIRSFVEYETVHRRFDNMGKYGMIFKILRIPVFCKVEFWYPVKMKTSVKFFTMNRRVAHAYNSWAVFEKKKDATKAGQRAG